MGFKMLFAICYGSLFGVVVSTLQSIRNSFLTNKFIRLVPMSRFVTITGIRTHGVTLTVFFVIMLTSALAQGDTLTMEDNTDRMGGDYRRIEASPSVEACRSACAADKECDAYTYVRSAHHCWLKRGVPGPTRNVDTVSGVKKRAVKDGICAAFDGVTCEPSTDRMGADYRRIDNAPSVRFCQRECANESKCTAYTYVKSARQCWLKSEVPNGTHNDDTVSGVKLHGKAPAGVPANRNTAAWRECDCQWLAHTCTGGAVIGTTRESCRALGGSYWHTNGHCGKGTCDFSENCPMPGHYCYK